jgi:hypothetical protein
MKPFLIQAPQIIPRRAPDILGVGVDLPGIQSAQRAQLVTQPPVLILQRLYVEF